MTLVRCVSAEVETVAGLRRMAAMRREEMVVAKSEWGSAALREELEDVVGPDRVVMFVVLLDAQGYYLADQWYWRNTGPGDSMVRMD